MQLIYETDIKLRHCDIDFKKRWRPGVIFLTMQEIGETHAEMLGVGFENLIKKNMIWVLVRASLEMERYPELKETVKIKSWPGAKRRLFFPRYYSFEDKEGILLGKASTLWTILDAEKRTIVSPAEKGVTVRYPERGPYETAFPGKVKQPEGEITRREIIPKYTDLDSNGHVNNSRYIDWLTDMIPAEIHRAGHLKKITSNYSREIRFDDRVTLEFSHSENSFRLSGREEDKIFFTVNADYCKTEKPDTPSPDLNKRSFS